MKEIMQNLLALQTLEFSETRDNKAAATGAELRGKIPAQILAHYDRLRVRGKKGVAAVRNQVCTGCHMGLPTGVIVTLMHNVDLQLCDNCGRYLFLPEPVAEVAAKAPEPKPMRKPRKRGEAAAPV